MDCRIADCMIGSAELSNFSNNAGVVLSFGPDFASHAAEESVAVRVRPRFTG